MTKKPVKLFKDMQKGTKKTSPLGDLVLAGTTAMIGTALIVESSKLINAVNV